MEWIHPEGDNHWFLIDTETQEVLASIMRGERFFNTSGRKFTTLEAAKAAAEQQVQDRRP